VSIDPELIAAAIDPLVAAEHPGLRVWTARVPGGTGRTPQICATGCGTSRAATAAPMRWPCARSRCRTRTGSSTAIWASIPT
jgi:hypothetical protein